MIAFRYFITGFYGIVSLLFCFMVHPAAKVVSVEPYQPERDLAAIRCILREYPYLTYEFYGHTEGSTELSLVCSGYMTDVVRVNGQTVGFIHYSPCDVTFLTFHILRTGFIYRLGVDRKHQRRGYGQMLLEHVLSRFEQLRFPEATATIKNYNIAAKALFEKVGFVCDGLKNERIHMTDLRYDCRLSVPEGELPRGNVIQRYPRSCLALLGAGLLLWKVL